VYEVGREKHVGYMSIRGFEALSCTVCPRIEDFTRQHARGLIIMVSHLPPCAPATSHMTRSSWCHPPLYLHTESDQRLEVEKA